MDLLVFSTTIGLILWAVTSTYVYQKDPGNTLNRSFLHLGLSTTLWGIGIVLRHTAGDETAARFFFNAAMLGAISTIAFFFRFALMFIRAAAESVPARVSSALQGFAFFSGGALFLLMVLTDWGAHGFPADGKTSTVLTGPLFTVVILWGLGIALVTVVLLVAYKGRMAKKRSVQQANTILIAMAVPAVSTGVLELALNATSQLKFIGEPFFSTVAFGLIIAWGTLRYGLMSVTPETAAAQIIESLPDSLLLIGPDGNVIAANRTFADLVGKPAREIERSPIWTYFISSGDGDPKASRISFSSTRRSDFRLDLLTPQGKIPVNVTTKSILDSSGERIGSMMLLRDMRQSQKIEAELVNAEKLASLGQLVAGVAHEINNPMTTVMGLSELGQKKFQGQPSEAFFDQILDQSVRIRNIVSQLLLFARKSEPKIEKADICRILSESAELVRMGLKSADVVIEKRFAAEKVEAVCDPEKLRQVFVNLIKNAFEAVHETGGRGTVTLSAESDGKWVRVEVADTGRGIDPENLQKIFNPFFTTKEIGKGTGLGLSISHAIIDAHGGKISATSEKGRGTVLLVELPAEPLGGPGV